jgi:hypothetical protein
MTHGFTLRCKTAVDQKRSIVLEQSCEARHLCVTIIHMLRLTAPLLPFISILTAYERIVPGSDDQQNDQ